MSLTCYSMRSLHHLSYIFMAASNYPIVYIISEIRENIFIRLLLRYIKHYHKVHNQLFIGSGGFLAKKAENIMNERICSELSLTPWLCA